MKYVIVKDAAGGLVCFGPDDGMYEPTLADGQTRHVVNEIPAPSKKQQDAEKAEADAVTATRSAVHKKLAALGFTADEIALFRVGT